LSGANTFAQDTNNYDDYQSFSSDPVELDEEVHELFGRYFHTVFGVGSMVPTGDLGAAYSAGYYFNLKFVLYMDRLWALEASAGMARLVGLYNETNTGKPAVNIDIAQTLIPFMFGFRYGFQMDALPKGIAMMHPYVSVGPGVFMRNEQVQNSVDVSGLEPDEQKRFTAQSVRNTTGYVFHAGGGVEFDVYRQNLYAGIETRYYATFWSDGDDFVGNLGRKGHMFSLQATLNHNFQLLSNVKNFCSLQKK
jgi:hypothetical protein